MLELRETASYAAVLLELGLTRINHFIKQLKINYVAKLVENKPNNQLLCQQQREDLEDCLLSKVFELCGKYGLPDCTQESIYIEQQHVQ